MQLFLLSALAGLSVAISNVTYFGAPRLSIGDTLPNRDAHGDVVAQVLGSTTEIDKPSCNGGSSANSRALAYYQAWNVRSRPCDKVWPSQIKLDGLTQLNLAFAYIDPKTFEIRLPDPTDDEVYRQFVELKSRSLQVWLGVGGWEFSDEGETRTTWSDMVSSDANRKAFITSTSQFLEEYGFQGLDIDWEWPAAANRGGRPEDTQNQVTLMKELRDALGKNYGLTCVLPHDNGYLNGIDVNSLSQYVDWFNVLTYDLHGSWDENDPALGAKIRPHTDLKEIDTRLEALWATGVDPGKFTLGLAYYGRGYTAADSNCLYYGCEFTGPSKQGACSHQSGVLSGCEIKRLIKEKNLTPGLITGGAGAMQLYWENQWMSYDNDETFALKKAFANERCMGGTAVWAIDYDSCNDKGELPPVGPGHSSVPSAGPTVSSIVSSIGLSSPVPSASSSVESSPGSRSSHPSSGLSQILTLRPTFPLSSTQPSSESSSTAHSSASFASTLGPQSSTSVFSSSEVQSSSSVISLSNSGSSKSIALSSEVQSLSTVVPTSESETSVSVTLSSDSQSSSRFSSITGNTPLPSSSPNSQVSVPVTSSVTIPSLSSKVASTSGSSVPMKTTTSLASSFPSSSTASSESASTVGSDTTSGIPTSSSSSSVVGMSSSMSSKPSSSASASSGASMLTPSSQPSRATGTGIDIPTLISESSSTSSKPDSSSSVSSGASISTPPSQPSSATGTGIDIPTLLSPSSTSTALHSEISTSLSQSSRSLGGTILVPTLSSHNTATITSNSFRSVTGTIIPSSTDHAPMVPWLVRPEGDVCPEGTARSGEKPGFFGCGCGWSGLPNGPGCPRPTPCGLLDVFCWLKYWIEMLWFEVTPCGQLFQCDVCKWFGCPGIRGSCGLLGCEGFCNSDMGCEPNCPAEVCGSCIVSGNCLRIQPGPPGGNRDNPDPTGGPLPTATATKRPSCEPKDYVTATEVLSVCIDKAFSVSANSTTTTTTCSGVFTQTMKGCPPIDGMTTTEWKTMRESSSCTESSTVFQTRVSCFDGPHSTAAFSTTRSCTSAISTIIGCDVTGLATTTVSSTSTAAGCTLAPLIFGEDEGDNSGLPTMANATMTTISIPTLLMAPNATSTGGSCSLSPLILDDEEGDNVRNITIPTLTMKESQTVNISIPTLTMAPNSTSTGGSCSLNPLKLDDDEGDNTQPDSMDVSIPTLTMKGSDSMNISIPTLTTMESKQIISIPTLTMMESKQTISIPTLTTMESKINIPTLTMMGPHSREVHAPSLERLTTSRDVHAPSLERHTTSRDVHAPSLEQTNVRPSPRPTPNMNVPIQAGGMWIIKIDHKVKNENSLKIDEFTNGYWFHWTLYDSNGAEAGGGGDHTPIMCVNRPPADCFPFDIEFRTKNLDSKDKAFIEFEVMMDLPSGRRMTFNTHDGPGNDLPEDGYRDNDYGCYDAEGRDWKGQDERHFKCHLTWLGAGGWDGESDGESDGPVPSDL